MTLVRSFIEDQRVYEALPVDLLQASRIPPRYWRGSLSQVPDADAHRQAVAAYIAGLKAHLEHGTGLRLWGEHGRGKTTLAVIIAKEALARGARVLFIPASDIAGSRIDDVAYSAECSMSERMRRVDLLVIDDLGADHGSDWGRSELEALLRERYNELRTTIVTSNKNPTELKAAISHGAWQVLVRATAEIQVQGREWGAQEMQTIQSQIRRGRRP